MVKVRILIGRTSGVSLRTLRKFVCKAAKVSKNAIGTISMSDTDAEVELRPEAARELTLAGVMNVQGHEAKVETIG